mmetsp:Transcript_41094/g.103288  ORF Transcript_41094/g.103288 Transcript_41094/m.103288 type:complete len:331 (+) Transcript_41094:548-1540(+)
MQVTAAWSGTSSLDRQASIAGTPAICIRTSSCAPPAPRPSRPDQSRCVAPSRRPSDASSPTSASPSSCQRPPPAGRASTRTCTCALGKLSSASGHRSSGSGQGCAAARCAHTFGSPHSLPATAAVTRSSLPSGAPLAPTTHSCRRAECGACSCPSATGSGTFASPLTASFTASPSSRSHTGGDSPCLEMCRCPTRPAMETQPAPVSSACLTRSMALPWSMVARERTCGVAGSTHRSHSSASGAYPNRLGTIAVGPPPPLRQPERYSPYAHSTGLFSRNAISLSFCFSVAPGCAESASQRALLPGSNRLRRRVQGSSCIRLMAEPIKPPCA